MSKNAVETVMGAVVLFVAGGFLAFAYNSTGMTDDAGGYELSAKFDNVGGISNGSDVRIGGIKVGAIKANKLDAESYRAVINMNIKPDVKIPSDSTASISSDGLLGGKYVSITPGGEDKMMNPGDEIKITQSSVSLEELIGKFVFSGGGVDKKEKESEGKPADDSSSPL